MSKESFVSDEICKSRPGQWECSHMVTGSGFGAFRLIQNLGMGQKEYPDRCLLALRHQIWHIFSGGAASECFTGR